MLHKAPNNNDDEEDLRRQEICSQFMEKPHLDGGY
jgi:hypothetical protein